MILIKRKKIIFVGVCIGLLWGVLSYVLSSSQEATADHTQPHQHQPAAEFESHRIVASGIHEVVRDGPMAARKTGHTHFSRKPITWLPPDMEGEEEEVVGRDGMVVGGGVGGGGGGKMSIGKHSRRKKPKKMKKQKKVYTPIEVEKKKLAFETGIKNNNPLNVQEKSSKLRFRGRKFGENGQPHVIDVSTLNASMQNVHRNLYKTFGYNAMVSSQISVHRSLPDVRSEACKKMTYATEGLPKVSVIMAFYNEAWSTLVRAVHAILKRTPAELLEEVILVDDGSTMDHLKQTLSDYLRLLDNKVKLHRTMMRAGVVQARQLGADASRAPVLLFLDSHVEVTVGWIEPLLKRISEDDTAVVTPVMDIIDDQTFAYKDFKYESINIGAFTWGLQFAWIGIPDRIKEKLASETDPISSPTMPGGMFAISKNQFQRLGGFDPAMNMWGGENFEMSFKVWMCGGKLETIPCSHVGHVFRKGNVYKLENSPNEKKNLQRVAELWMDDYKKFYYEKTKTTLGDIGDIKQRQRLREELKCHSFDWYINNVYPEMFVSSKALISGEIRNFLKARGDGTEFAGCIDGASSQTKSMSVWPCHGQGGNQLWMLSSSGEIRNDDNCFDFAGTRVVLFPCHGHRGNQEWIFTPSSGEIMHKGTQLCLGLDAELSALSMERCTGDKRQKWLWGDSQRVREATSFKTLNVGDGGDYVRQENVVPGQEGDYNEEEEEAAEDEVQLTGSKHGQQRSTTKKVEYEYYEEDEEVQS